MRLAILLLPLLIVLIIANYLAKTFFGYGGLWLEAKAARLPLAVHDIFRMHFQKTPVALVHTNMKMLKKAGIPITCRQLERHFLSGGDLDNTSAAAIAARKAGLPMNFDDLAAIDLAGRDVLGAVNRYVNPTVLNCPDKSSPDGITAVAKDGIRLGIRARITVRTRMDKLIGTAGASTVLARVGEGIVSSIGRAATHRLIVENPTSIAQYILSHDLDANTCYEIMSVDIQSISILDNVSADLKKLQAETDTRIANARAEERRALAVASTQEMKARTLESEVKVREARKALPTALASGLKRRGAVRTAPIRMLSPHRIFWR